MKKLSIYKLALAISLLERRGFHRDDFAALHPAGRLGNKLLRVGHLMHSGDSLPRVAPETPMPATFHEMSAKKLGMTTVATPDGKLAGILTDGDLRRLMEKHGGATLSMTAGDCMIRNPQTIDAKLLASEALVHKKKVPAAALAKMRQRARIDVPRIREIDVAAGEVGSVGVLLGQGHGELVVVRRSSASSSARNELLLSWNGNWNGLIF